MSDIDDLSTRVVAQKQVAVLWVRDWACLKCHKFGGILVHQTGDKRDEDGLPVPDETEEQMLRMVFDAHRGDFGLCRATFTTGVVPGRLWRWEKQTGRGPRMIVCREKNEVMEGTTVTEYAWPPWAKGS